jgi:hypothetical protein
LKEKTFSAYVYVVNPLERICPVLAEIEILVMCDSPHLNVIEVIY